MNNPLRIGLIIGTTTLFFGLIVAGGYFISQYQKSRDELFGVNANPQAVTERENKKILGEVDKLVQLPKGEQPTIATVTDLSKLKGQEFFKQAKNGDKVIIYSQARKAILYDPLAKKIIDISPINSSSASAQVATPSGTLATSVPLKVVLRNGTNTTGLTTKYEPKIKSANDKSEIIKKENASNPDYEKSTLVVLNPSLKTEAESLAKSLNLSVGILPVGESKPAEGDVLIILGKDNSSL